MKESALIIFTLLAQFAVGAFWALGAVYLTVALQIDAAAARAWAGTPLLAIVGMIGAAVLASLAHLGAPRNAWRALANLRTSWLSREILFAGLFGGLAAITAGLVLAGAGSLAWQTLVGGAAGVCGLLLVYSMANVYRLRTMPAWDCWMTPAAFFVTAALLGCLLAGALLAGSPPGAGQWVSPGVQFWMAGGTLFSLLAALVAARWLNRLFRQNPDGAGALFGRFGLAWYVRMGLMGGCALLCMCAYLGVYPAAAASAAGVLALAGEAAGRLLFYEAGELRPLG